MNSSDPLTSVEPLLVDIEGHKECLLGNEAIVRGALEAGVAFASGYPGTPSSEVTDSFARISKLHNINFEYSVNEKVALEMAFAASLAGARSICAMKHLGLMYAGDPLSTIPYIGVRGGMVIVSAGDPSCRTSPNEQDQRYLGPMLLIPILDPSTPEEAYEMARFAFDLSEESRLPVIIRITTRICHSRGIISYRRLPKPIVRGFVRDPQTMTPLPAHSVKMRIELTVRIDKAEKMMSESAFISQTGLGELAIIASGSPAATCSDILAENDLTEHVTVLTLGLVFPLPKKPLLSFMQQYRKILIIEELSPYIEDALGALCNQHNITAEIIGKRTGHLPIEFEYEPEIITPVIKKFIMGELEEEPKTELPLVPPRPPILCPGCPHRSTYLAARTVFGDDYLYFNDIGCYTLGFGPPLNTADALLCMGAAFTLAAGVSRVTGQRTVAFLGDSTFFHSGMPALLNVIKENANIVAVILDNQVTAMTGFQESPTVTVVHNKAQREISIEAVVRALGAQEVEMVDPYDLSATIKAFEKARDDSGVSVVIAKHPCPVFMARETGQSQHVATYEVDHSLCQTCGRETSGLRCSLDTCEEYERNMVYCRGRENTSTESLQLVAPCSINCPLDLCIQGYVGNIAAGLYQEAFQLIMSQCPLPETVCRVCHRPCEDVCVRKLFDEPVAINDLKRFIIEWAASNNIEYKPNLIPEKGKKIAVVGAGPAGLAAAHDLKLRGYTVTIFDQEQKPGGLLQTGIPLFRLPRQALDRDIQRILGLGISFQGENKLGRDFSLDNLLEQDFEAIFVAIGAWQSLDLKLNGDNGSTNAPSILNALTYLKNIRLEQKQVTEKHVVVIGGGNAAVDAARTARRSGAKRVVIIYRRHREEMPAISEEIIAAEKEGIELHTQYIPIELRQETNCGIVCLKTEPGEPDISGRSRPTPVVGTETFFKADQILVAIGQAVDTQPLHMSNGSLTLTSTNLLHVDSETGRTSHEKIFAGGDMVQTNRTVTDAIAWGKLAAWSIDCQVSGTEQAGPKPALSPVRSEKTTSRSHIIQTKSRKRVHPIELDPKERTVDFSEVKSVLTESQARKEASRCLICGLCGNCRSCIDIFGCPAFYIENDRITIDPLLCIGCGICAHFCPNKAIKKVHNE